MILNFLLGYDYQFLWPWLGQGLLTSSGARWQSRRKLLTKAFHGEILKHFVDVMNQHATKLSAKFEQYAAKQKICSLQEGNSSKIQTVLLLVNPLN